MVVACTMLAHHGNPDFMHQPAACLSLRLHHAEDLVPVAAVPVQHGNTYLRLYVPYPQRLILQAAPCSMAPGTAAKCALMHAITGCCVRLPCSTHPAGCDDDAGSQRVHRYVVDGVAMALRRLPCTPELFSAQWPPQAQHSHASAMLLMQSCRQLPTHWSVPLLTLITRRAAFRPAASSRLSPVASLTVHLHAKKSSSFCSVKTQILWPADLVYIAQCKSASKAWLTSTCAWQCTENVRSRRCTLAVV
jgi:hypothetical protein